MSKRVVLLVNVNEMISPGPFGSDTLEGLLLKNSIKINDHEFQPLAIPEYDSIGHTVYRNEKTMQNEVYINDKQGSLDLLCAGIVKDSFSFFDPVWTSQPHLNQVFKVYHQGKVIHEKEGLVLLSCFLESVDANSKLNF